MKLFRTTLSLSFCLLFTVCAWAQQKVASTISQVEVFVRGAEVTRTAQLTLNPGNNELVLTKLSPDIDPNSIRLMANANFTVLSIQHQLNHINGINDPEETVKVQTKLEGKQLEMDLLQNAIDAVTFKKELILKNHNISSSKEGLLVEDLLAMADYYRSSLKAIELDLLKKNQDKTALRKEITLLKNELKQLNAAQRPSSEIHLNLNSNKQNSSTLSISYVVHSAGWRPFYDLRVKEESQSVYVQYKAYVWQNSGIDWTQIPVELSSSLPTQNQDIPELSKIELNTYQQKRERKQELQQLSYFDANNSVQAFGDAYGFSPEPVQNSSIVTFKSPKRQSIPSDREEYLISLTEFSWNPEFEYFTVPKLKEKVFITALIPEWHTYNLISGQTAIYQNGSFLGKGYLSTDTPEDTLRVSLGYSEDVVVQRKDIEKYSSTRVIGTQKLVQTGVQLTLKNNLPFPVDLHVQDQIPLSRNEDIQVTTKDLGGAKYDAKSGTLDWYLTLTSGESAEKAFYYDVKYPKHEFIPGF